MKLLHFAHANGIPAGSYAALFKGLEPNFIVTAKPIIGMDVNYPINNGWQNQVAELINYLEQQTKLHQQQQIHCVGHSFGALISLLAAYQRPDLIASVTMLDPPIITGLKSFGFWIIKGLNPVWSDKFSPARFSKYRRDHWATKQEAAHNLLKKPFYAAFDKASFDAYIDYGISENADGAFLTIPKAVEVEIFRTNPAYFWYKPRHAPKVPTFLAVGQTSEFNMTGMSQSIAEQLSIPLTLHQGGHMFPLEYPQQTAEWITTTLNI